MNFGIMYSIVSIRTRDLNTKINMMRRLFEETYIQTIKLIEQTL